jgi:hypothetical protein
VRGLLGDRISDLPFRTGAIPMRFPSAEFFADFFIANYGPTHKAADEALAGERRTTFRAGLVDLATRTNRAGDDAVISDWEYLVAIASRAE